MVTTLVIKMLERRKIIIGGALDFGLPPIEALNAPPYNTLQELDDMLNDKWKVVWGTYALIDRSPIMYLILYKPNW